MTANEGTERGAGGPGAGRTPGGGTVPPGAYVRCAELVEQLTDYLEGALSAERTALLDEHLTLCEGCRSLRRQWRTVVDLAARVAPDAAEDLDPDTRSRLLAAFRDASAGDDRS